MNYEKKYKESLELARDYYKANLKLDKADENLILEDIFPELTESEDEMMMHQLHSWMKEFGGAEEYTEKVYTWLKSLLEKQGELIDKLVKYREWLISKTEQWTERKNDKTNSNAGKHCCIGAANALISARAEFEEIFDYESWFEKQGKQEEPQVYETEDGEEITYSESEGYKVVKPKFHEGDWITNGDYTWKIVEVKPLDYILQAQDGNIVDDTISHVDEQFHSFTIEDTKDGDVLATDDWVFIFKELNAYGKPVCYCHYDDELGFKVDVNSYMATGSEIYPATKEQCNILFAKMKEIGYEWDADKKELKKIEQKSTNKNLTNVDHEYYSDLLSNDNSDNIDDYAYQCAYCMSHDWMKESATWEDVQKAVKLGAEWQKQKPAWSEEDESILQGIWDEILANKHDAKEYEWKTYDKFLNWLKSLKSRVLQQPKYEWKQENTDNLTDFENTMMHIGDSFFGENAGLDPNDTDTVKEQAELLLELAPSKEWSKEDDYNLQCMIAKAVKDIRDGNVGRNNELIYWLKSIKQRIVGKV